MAGNAQAQLEIGRHHAEGKVVPYDLDEAYRWFRLAANHDLPDALLEVALAHEYGLGADVDYDAAFEYYMEALRLHPKPLPFKLRGMVLTQNICLAKHRGQLALAEAGYAHCQWAFAYGPQRDPRRNNTMRWVLPASSLVPLRRAASRREPCGRRRLNSSPRELAPHQHRQAGGPHPSGFAHACLSARRSPDARSHRASRPRTLDPAPGRRAG